jgi:hypothetical protein
VSIIFLQSQEDQQEFKWLELLARSPAGNAHDQQEKIAEGGLRIVNKATDARFLHDESDRYINESAFALRF